jgi:cytoskeletal protein CcmA (bactofilin family)
MLSEINTVSHLAEASRVSGEIRFTSCAEIYGIVEGQLLQESLEALVVGRPGWVCGDIISKGPVTIAGRVCGNITSSSLIRLLPTAIVEAKLVAPVIEVYAGSIVNGQFEMKTDKLESAAEDGNRRANQSGTARSVAA